MQGCGKVGLSEQGGYGTDGECFRRQDGNVETQCQQGITVFCRSACFRFIDTDGDRNQQGLSLQVLFVQCAFEFFIDDTFMSGVHIDEYESVPVLCKDVDVVQLRQCKTKRKFVCIVLRCDKVLNGIVWRWGYGIADGG